MKRLSIIIPAYNEEKSILSILDTILKVDLDSTEKELIVINDYSTDSTKELVIG